MAAQLYKTHTGQLFHAGSIVIINVGLPARGKTHGSRSLIRYMNWLGVKSKSFHMGQYRRRLYGPDISADYFDLGNEEMAESRVKAENSCIEDIIEYLTTGGGQLAIFDASNLRATRRRQIYDKFEELKIRPLFIEYICEKETIVEENIRKVKISSPDYITMDPEVAVFDFKERIARMAPHYETIEDIDLSYIKLYNVGEHFVVNNIRGYLQSRVVFYMMNLHISDRTIYLARSGESSNEGSYKADAPLSATGHNYARNLRDEISRRIEERNKYVLAKTGVDMSNRTLKVWTSTHVKSYQTAEYFASRDNVSVRRRMLLKGLNPGVCENLTLEEVKDKFPSEYQSYLRDPYHHRYSLAESYHDVSVRLEPVILELEREHDDILIIAPESALRCIYAYFAPQGMPDSLIPTLAFPRSIFVELTPTAYGCKERRIGISPSNIDSAAADKVNT
ncbi:bifunctional 6-phosphofructo-2-kinase/fructose-2,6-bisphosphate 2-phosphatase [Coemansia reversa NRRL 1564]|uniref:Bifunctional 6-phosphofructo-2-kinase/fructose-2,6-bisphosphate 2-phosphatase n=1 Tax=Coemansia reversa (strain ATCC 12441 / NRRL 1564) TaxID=763665 RepID=A0A2G5BAZ6_COERN|nr:bifunctional 6-phosphofructo-2-kinase/fructose-2,6-bisphosphate 2-phosphatase [Coemansia reversa NRRL 1564]|eukprot:PIA15887.1 bifunctional 6-phosphofructo-2-kinase/fructose-2,6-bisphosphate 2-phosphatase [Coemansia reversa NRRL 1564]